MAVRASPLATLWCVGDAFAGHCHGAVATLAGVAAGDGQCDDATPGLFLTASRLSASMVLTVLAPLRSLGRGSGSGGIPPWPRASR